MYIIDLSWIQKFYYYYFTETPHSGGLKPVGVASERSRWWDGRSGGVWGRGGGQSS